MYKNTKFNIKNTKLNFFCKNTEYNLLRKKYKNKYKNTIHQLVFKKDEKRLKEMKNDLRNNIFIYIKKTYLFFK